MWTWRAKELTENAIIFVAYRLPKRLAYWCAIRLASGNGNGGAYEGNPGDRTCADMLKAHNSWAR
jgi:hypothetical protein